jgi:hypothetical protein
MNKGNGHDRATGTVAAFAAPEPIRQLLHDSLHPAWRAFLQFCGELQHGEIERLKIQDGLPVLAEVVKKKVKFSG